MCLLFIAVDAHPDHSLVIAGNRDEFYERPTASAAFWDDAPNVLAGRDLQGGGTWLGVSREGRWAAVTNYREPQAPGSARSRGHLVSQFLLGTATASAYAAAVLKEGSRYSGFNLLLGDGRQAVYCSNRSPEPTLLKPGVYGLSNHLLDTPWPKLVRGKARFSGVVKQDGPLDEEAVFRLLGDQELAPTDQLPDTGVGIELERRLSPAFIVMDGYGTRSSTVLTIRKEGELTLAERRYAHTPTQPATPAEFETSRFELALP